MTIHSAFSFEETISFGSWYVAAFEECVFIANASLISLLDEFYIFEKSEFLWSYSFQDGVILNKDSSFLSFLITKAINQNFLLHNTHATMIVWKRKISIDFICRSRHELSADSLFIFSIDQEIKSASKLDIFSLIRDELNKFFILIFSLGVG